LARVSKEREGATERRDAAKAGECGTVSVLAGRLILS
jgi:hypothetical protein